MRVFDDCVVGPRRGTYAYFKLILPTAATKVSGEHGNYARNPPMAAHSTNMSSEEASESHAGQSGQTERAMNYGTFPKS